jgi:hypothetical protein
MNKLSALEQLKVNVVIADGIKKLRFLSTLKSTGGSEMAEMMSEEISRVMTEQRELEMEYARLVQKRGELKGLSNKQEL